MDHILSYEKTPFLKVPYVCLKDYPSPEHLSSDFHWENWSRYPRNEGWSEEDILDLHFGERTPDEIRSFLQSWFFFGVPIEAMARVDIRAGKADFLRRGTAGELLITTEELPGFFQQWRDNVRKQQSRWIDQLYFFKEVERTLCAHANSYCNVRSRKRRSIGSLHKPHHWPLSDEISLSILGLGCALQCAVAEIYRDWNVDIANLRVSWGESILINSQLLQNGWCPNDVAMFDNRISIDSQFYFTSISYLRGSRDHSQCTFGECLAENIDLATYKTKHVDQYCNCKFYAPSTERVLAILSNGGVPLVSWTQDPISKDGKIEVAEADRVNYCGFRKDVESRSGCKPEDYVALSHVWADGLETLTEILCRNSSLTEFRTWSTLYTISTIVMASNIGSQNNVPCGCSPGPLYP